AGYRHCGNEGATIVPSGLRVAFGNTWRLPKSPKTRGSGYACRIAITKLQTQLLRRRHAQMDRRHNPRRGTRWHAILARWKRPRCGSLTVMAVRFQAVCSQPASELSSGSGKID